MYVVSRTRVISPGTDHANSHTTARTTGTVEMCDTAMLCQHIPNHARQVLEAGKDLASQDGGLVHSHQFMKPPG